MLPSGDGSGGGILISDIGSHGSRISAHFFGLFLERTLFDCHFDGTGQGHFVFTPQQLDAHLRALGYVQSLSLGRHRGFADGLAVQTGTSGADLDNGHLGARQSHRAKNQKQECS